MRRLSINGVQLLDNIDCNISFIAQLASPQVRCITWSQKDHLMNIAQPRDRNDKLLEFLTRRSIADFEKFIQVLAIQQAHLVPLLVTNGGEIYTVFQKWYTKLISITLSILSRFLAFFY